VPNPRQDFMSLILKLFIARLRRASRPKCPLLNTRYAPAFTAWSLSPPQRTGRFGHQAAMRQEPRVATRPHPSWVGTERATPEFCYCMTISSATSDCGQHQYDLANARAAKRTTKNAPSPCFMRVCAVQVRVEPASADFGTTIAVHGSERNSGPHR
jgi:hypothetical protein